MEKELIKEKIDNLYSIEVSEEQYEKEEQMLLEKYSKITDELSTRFNVAHYTEFEHYGSGYASFIDCWLSPSQKILKDGILRNGIIILFHRKYDYYVMGEGVRSFTSNGMSSYLPKLELVDNFSSQEMKIFSKEIEKYLTSYDLLRLRKKHLVEYLPKDYSVTTIMNESPYTYFDGLFHWAD